MIKSAQVFNQNSNVFSHVPLAQEPIVLCVILATLKNQASPKSTCQARHASLLAQRDSMMKTSFVNHVRLNARLALIPRLAHLAKLTRIVNLNTWMELGVTLNALTPSLATHPLCAGNVILTARPVPDQLPTAPYANKTAISLFCQNLNVWAVVTQALPQSISCAPNAKHLARLAWLLWQLVRVVWQVSSWEQNAALNALQATRLITKDVLVVTLVVRSALQLTPPDASSAKLH